MSRQDMYSLLHASASIAVTLRHQTPSANISHPPLQPSNPTPSTTLDNRPESIPCPIHICRTLPWPSPATPVTSLTIAILLQSRPPDPTSARPLDRVFPSWPCHSCDISVLPQSQASNCRKLTPRATGVVGTRDPIRS
ncbi:hypothetical protein BS50DRAFT_364977 [Corynespora cassiicola Philippines]|uniref:Uncharacterized protein n=1 Tax=Corynespora cassiicola Philippines TaxID=1448308 RepID=A0A2T2NSP7_CORCC|nr:hypothetical protein BS50DRAFT_364977 [Corynespora cassiicola Philippines]